MVDDEIISIKSTSIKFKKNIKLFVGSCYFITFFISLFNATKFGCKYFHSIINFLPLSLIYQLIIFDKKMDKNV